MITAVPGVRVGHWSDPVALTGCTVILLPAGTVASGSIRGGAPGTREWALLEPGRSVERVDAVVVAGGSAFGLAACDGVMRWCGERGIGYPTPAGPVPIVVGMVVYDLMVGDPSVRPGPDQGYEACLAARAGEDAAGHGPAGAGTGATVGKWRGPDGVRPGGIGSAVWRDGEGLVVAALMVVNAIGEPRGDGLVPDSPRLPYLPIGDSAPPDPPEMQATTVGVIATNAVLDKAACRRVADSGHDGLARALDPAHTAGDGDAIVAAATGSVDVGRRLEVVRSAGAWVVERAINNALAAPPPPPAPSPPG